MRYVGLVLLAGCLAAPVFAQQAAPAPSVQEIVNEQGSLAPLDAGKCGQTRVLEAEQKIQNQLKLKQFVDAHGDAATAAHTLAACELHPEIWNRPGQKAGVAPAPEQLQQHIGRALAFEYLAASAGGSVTPEDVQAKQNALTLFRAAGDGEGGSLTKLLTAAEDKQTKDAAQISLPTVTGRTFVSAYQDNQAAFNAKYAGKRVTIDTTIRAISSSYVALNGIVNKDPDKARLQDDIACNVTDAAALVSLHRNQRVRVTGIYDKEATERVGPVSVNQCTIEPAPGR